VTSPAPVARPDAIRRHNLGMLLGQIHRNGSLTRAELTQRLNLSRSTIGALVAELTELGLVDEEVPTGGERAGRPSHVVGPRPNGPYVVAVDVDISHVTAAAVGIGGTVLARRHVPTVGEPPTPRSVAAQINECVLALGEEVPRARPVAIGVSVPGTVRSNSGRVEFAPNLSWRHEPFGELLDAVTPRGLTVTIGNDADLAVLAEHLRGSARGSDDVIYLMARIGVGAGIISSGRPLHGHHGLAGEVGHTVVDASGPLCHCGKRGCVETYIGENAMLSMAGRPVPATPAAVAALFADAQSGDKVALKAVRAVADALGRTVANLANVLNPERVLLGGSLAGVLEVAPEDVERSLGEHVMGGSDAAVELLPPGLGEDSALLGAAELAFARLLADPVLLRC
jgi:predicted NBD/HSP70 family sugar kinase